jgi:ribosomal protein RSM22 (predicted rRNA methylase)
MPHLLHQFASEADLVKAVGELSAAFTTDRANLQKYLSDPRLVSAYTAFYLTTNLPKLAAVMSWLTPDFRADILQHELVDVGAGPGTFCYAWKELGGGESIMLETSKLMREQAARLLPQARFALGDKHKPRLLLFGHSLNEMGVEAGLKYVSDAKPEHVWMIEPGTKEVFALALEFRRRMIRDGWHVRYPCLGMGECPMSGRDDWCHQYVDVRHDADVERLTQLAQRDRRHLPLTVMMFEREPIARRDENLARIVRTLPATKFSHEWQVCRGEGELELERFQLPFKSYPKAERKAVEALLAGSLIQFEVEKVTSDYRRIRLLRKDNSE